MQQAEAWGVPGEAGQVVKVVNAIYETDFLGFSYGFRPGRNPHNALDALYVGIMRKRVNWMLDADIRGFFDAIDHGWLMKFVEHRIAMGRGRPRRGRVATREGPAVHAGGPRRSAQVD